jgi:formate hydrogenlyase subunit 3/multisubunit Na+/H+ antiporter MnhD subunit
LSWIAFVRVGFGHMDERVVLFTWMQSGDLKVDWALRIDALTAVMLVVVTTVSSLVHLYSIGYMHEDPHRPRFFAYLSLFTFAMLMLVTSDNLAQLFFGWEGVGLASYLLDRILVSEARGQCRRDQGLRGQPRRRLRLRARHLRALHDDGCDRFRHRLRASSGR